MPSEKHDSKSTEKKEPKLEIRDLKPKKEIKGGVRNSGGDQRRSPGTKGEIDFMGWD